MGAPKLDLIPDHALESAQDDRLRHSDLAEELSSLVLEAKTPANVALYGRWGSGKTGMANLLEAKLESRKDVKFARFDAFKYAQTPLRRHFLSQIARELSIESAEFTSGLYASSVDNTFSMPVAKARKLFGVFSAVIGIGVVIALCVVAVLAGIQDGSFGENFWGMAKTGAAVSLAPSTLLAAFIAMAGKALTVTTETAPPFSEEEFEQLFRSLVKKSKAKRLVVFVDELDRCSPGEVVTTLETIRTFLDIPGCVFVVAADQQVLERALAKEARQANPIDTSNPYYSAGSAYLDKIFQYQVELPPLMSRKLTRFAFELVEGRGGIWDEVDRAEVISVLIPTHVRSPRRVKRLLNNFVLSYRIARRRSESGALGGDLPSRASELAKLVCLRTEFPLFAAEVARDARLVGLVTDLIENPDAELGEGLPESLVSRARGYAGIQLPVAELMVADRAAGQDGATSDRVAELDETDESVEVSEVLTPSASDLGAIQDSLARQLEAYLQKTSVVPGPGRDLIHVEGPGADFDLDPDLSLNLEDAAVDGRRQTAIGIVEGLNQEGRVAAIRLLASLVRESPIGLEGSNAISTLLQVMGSAGVDVSEFVDEIAVAVAAQIARYELLPGDLLGALSLGLQSSGAVGDDLISEVLWRDEAEEPELALEILRRSADVFDRMDPADEVEERLGFLSAVQLTRFDSAEVAEHSVEALVGLSPGRASEVMEAATEEITARYGEAVTVFDELGDEKPDETADPSAVLGGIIEDLIGGERKAAGEIVAAAMLGANTRAGRDQIEYRIAVLKPVQTDELTLSILTACRVRAPRLWPKWLECLSPSVVRDLAVDADERLQTLVQRLWALALGDEPPTVEVATAALAALQGIARREAWDFEAMETAISESLALRASDEAEASVLDYRLEMAMAFVEGGVAEVTGFAEAALGSLGGSLALGLPVQQPDSGVVACLTKWIPELIEHGSSDVVSTCLQQIRSCAFLPSPIRESLLIDTAAAAGEQSPFDAEEMRGLVELHGREIDAGLARWITSYGNDPGILWGVVEPLVGGQLPERTSTALRGATELLTPEQRFQLAKPAVDGVLSTLPHTSFFEAVRFSESDHDATAAAIVERFESATNTDQRTRVLSLWEQLRPVDSGVRGRLITSIYVPLAKGSKAGLDLAVRNIHLVRSPPHGTKALVVNTLRDAASNDGQRRRVDAQLVKAGLAKKRRLRRKLEITED